MQHCDASVLGIAEANFITGPKKTPLWTILNCNLPKVHVFGSCAEARITWQEPTQAQGHHVHSTLKGPRPGNKDLASFSRLHNSPLHHCVVIALLKIMRAPT